MKYFFLSLAALIVIINMVDGQKSYCNTLKTKMYNNRQKILVIARDRCENTTNAYCINEVFRLQSYLQRFDDEVLKHEGCL